MYGKLTRHRSHTTTHVGDLRWSLYFRFLSRQCTHLQNDTSVTTRQPTETHQIRCRGSAPPDHLWTPHSRLYSCAIWAGSTPLDLARNTGSQGGCATCPTHDCTAHERLSEHTRVLPGDRKLRKAAESGWSPSNQMGPNRNRCRSATV